MRTHVVARVLKTGIPVRIHPQVRCTILNNDAMVGVVPQQRAPTLVTGAPLEHVRVRVLFTISEGAASSSLQVSVVQVPVRKGVIFLDSHLRKSHAHFAIHRNVCLLRSGVEIEYRIVDNTVFAAST